MTKQEGGKVIASGGFGCIFRPALKCDNSVSRESNKISKLMSVKHASDEYKQINTFKHILQTIPNYSNYFLIDDFTLCKPSKLTKEDLYKYSKKCKALKKKDILSKNINSKLDKILALNMPYGGIDIEKFIYEYFVSNNIVRLNNSLINLLVNGIIPMNELNVYHCDIKDSNILIEIKDPPFSPRLIDWGISIIYDKSSNAIPKQLYRRPFQFNVPFSSVLFNNEFSKLYNDFLNLNKTPDYFQIREFVVNYIFIWNDVRGSGHLSAINDIINKLTIKELMSVEKQKIKDHLVEYDFTYYYIIEYLSKILEKYTQNGKLNIMAYFNNVFLRNIDIWGFIMTYITFYEYLYDKYSTLNEYQMQFIMKIKYIIIHFLYESPIEPINVPLLVKELTSLNPLIERFDDNVPSTKLQYEKGGKTNKTKLTNKSNNKSTNKTKTKSRNKTKRRKLTK
jgi:hypothetical protein